MEFDESKKLDVEISQNQFVENKVQPKRRHKRLFDALDLAIIPVTIGVFVSLGFLFANLFKATGTLDAIINVANALM